ncbi:imidazole glycerol phosphate synthase subunit HisH [Mucilaginibacter sp.]|uniref:imidazole glycerol phosphate synthase subunit HisH n=1 Tax=Mucilaginibacter sp. TaxID=1882438 RepID=UPI003B00A1CA
MIGIIQYGAGNIFSLTAALDRLGIEYGMISQESDFGQYDRYIIPGVGHAGAAMQKLEKTGLVPVIRKITKPVLGICVGMQLITAFSEEGNADLLNIIPIKTLKFKEENGLKIPHTGWNQVSLKEGDDLFKNIKNQAYFYFVHSYFIEHDNLYTLASTQYGVRFSASIKKDNFYGVQFHPEKSGLAGEQLLKNFAHLNA